LFLFLTKASITDGELASYSLRISGLATYN